MARTLLIILVAAVIGGGAVYAGILYLGYNPVEVDFQVNLAQPTLSPAQKSLPASLAPMLTPTVATQLTPTPPATAPPTPTPTRTAAPAAPTAAPTPTAHVVTEREIVVNAFAGCNGQYAGEEMQRRLVATNSAIDRGFHSAASIRALVEQECNGVFPALAANAKQIAGTPEAGPTQTRPTALSTPTRAQTSTLLPTPVPTLAPTATPASAKARFDARALEKEVHQLINSERVKHGLPGLEWNKQIAAIARAHSEDMARRDYFSHDNLEGESPTDRAIAAGYPCRKSLGGGSYSYGLAENIWTGWEYSSYTYGPGGTRYNWMSQTQLAAQAVSSWMNSPGHRDNILTPQYDRTGIGVGFGIISGKKHTVYLTQNFC